MPVRWLLFCVGLWMIPTLALAQYGLTAQDFFPSSPIIDTQKEFWIQIFTDVQSNEGLLHDGALNQPVYERLKFGDMKRRNQNRLIERRKKEAAAALRKAAGKMEAGQALDGKETALIDRFRTGVTPKILREAAAESGFNGGWRTVSKRA